MSRRFEIEDLVVYEKPKHGTRPTVRAHDVRPAARGDDYDYVVDKLWIVTRGPQDGRLLVRTPGGKQHEVDCSDPRLRKPTLFERIRLHLFGRDRLRALRQTGT